MARQKNNSMKAKLFIFFTIYILFLNYQFNAQENLPVAKIQIERLVEIPRLSSYNEIFKQFCVEVEKNSMRNARGSAVEMMLYRYKVQKGETLFTIAARCSIPYETIATLNAIASPVALEEGTTLLIPNVAGVFVYDNPQSALEIIVAKSDYAIAQNPEILYNVALPSAKSARNCFFIQNARFSPTERAYFLDTSLRLPLDNYWLSSNFGMRISPISGKWRFHNGIDMAANEGTPVFACKGGKVQTAQKGDVTFGNYIVLAHDSGMTSLYAHLSEIQVAKGESVSGGSQIGKVGQTGLATGPHLHFEVWMNGVATDPQKLISK